MNATCYCKTCRGDASRQLSLSLEDAALCRSLPNIGAPAGKLKRISPAPPPLNGRPPCQALPLTRLSLSKNVICQEVDVLLQHPWQERSNVLGSQLGSRLKSTRGPAETIAGFYFEKRPELFGLNAVSSSSFTIKATAPFETRFSTSRGPEDST